MRVYQCDRCKKIFEPYVLPRGAKYITRKGERDIDLCEDCMKSFFFEWFGIHSEEETDNEM